MDKGLRLHKGVFLGQATKTLQYDRECKPLRPPPGMVSNLPMVSDTQAPLLLGMWLGYRYGGTGRGDTGRVVATHPIPKEKGEAQAHASVQHNGNNGLIKKHKVCDCVQGPRQPSVV